MSLFAELKRRNVFRVGIAYMVVAWLVLQVADVVINNIGAPDWVFQAIMLVLGLGFPLVLIFAWAFEMTPEGLQKEKDVDRSQSITGKTGRKLDFTIIGVLIMVAAYFVWESRFQVDEASTISSAPTVIPANAGNTNFDDNSIAVLPFANRSNVDDDLFFTDGIHDDLLTQLAKISGLKVISRTSVMEYRETTKKIPEIARELGVSKILEGGVQRAGKRIRINAQLIDVATDQHLWAETFDREMTIENLFDIQSEITRQIVSAVKLELTETQQRSLARVPTNNLQAYENYLQARA
ncbi:MAG: adenylyl cyclase, partial [Xanthomonadales bacterium]|nr:adenylyl cyclase [Xanthomonadales bacterium]